MKAPHTHVGIDQATQTIVVVFPPPMPPLSLTAEEAEALAQILLTQAKSLKVQQSNQANEAAAITNQANSQVPLGQPKRSSASLPPIYCPSTLVKTTHFSGRL